MARFYRLIITIAAMLLLASCDSGWAIAARNEDDQAWLLRVSYLDITQVFRIEPGATTGMLGSLGPLPQPIRAELLDDSCAVITSFNVPSSASYSMLVIRPDQTLVISRRPPNDQVGPADPEVRGGKCGGLP